MGKEALFRPNVQRPALGIQQKRLPVGQQKIKTADGKFNLQQKTHGLQGLAVQQQV
jgi:hypothetical protein